MKSYNKIIKASSALENITGTAVIIALIILHIISDNISKNIIIIETTIGAVFLLLLFMLLITEIMLFKRRDNDLDEKLKRRCKLDAYRRIFLFLQKYLR